jgi:transposase InsO family protein
MEVLPQRIEEELDFWYEQIVQIKRKEKSVTQVARESGYSRKTVHQKLRRYDEAGIFGLIDGRINNGREPSLSPEEIEQVVQLKVDEMGLSTRKLISKAPEGLRPKLNQKKVWRILNQYGLNRKPKRPQKITRFEKSRPNILWQLDVAPGFHITGEGLFHYLVILDDHSRYLINLSLVLRESSAEVLPQLKLSLAEYGLPGAILTDNAAVYHPLRKTQRGVSQGMTKYERALKELRIKPKRSRPYHPQSKGKVEKLIQFIQKDLFAGRRFKSFAELEEALVEWRRWYNEEHYHSAIKCSPVERYRRSAVRATPEELEKAFSDVATRKVRGNGNIKYKRRVLFLGLDYAGEEVELRVFDEQLWIYWREKLIRRFPVEILGDDTVTELMTQKCYRINV